MSNNTKVDKRTLLYRSNRAQLLCGWCGAPNCPTSLCPDCAAKNQRRIRKRYKTNRAVGKCGYCGKKCKTAICKKCYLPHQRWMRRNKRKGLCYTCGNERAPGSTKCAKCLVNNRLVHRRLYRKRIDAGVCPYCEKKPDEGVQVCATHRNYDHKRMNMQNRKRYKKCKAEGMCVRCQKTEAIKDRVLCQPCKIIVNETSRKCAQRRANEKRKDSNKALQSLQGPNS